MLKTICLARWPPSLWRCRRSAGRLCCRHHRRADRPAGHHLCAGGRGAAHLHRPRQRCRRHQRQEGQAGHRRTTCAAFQGRGQCQEADHQDNVGADGQRQPVFDLCAGDRRDQERRSAAAVRQRRLPEERLPAGGRASVLHHRLRRQLRQPGHARLRQRAWRKGR